MLTTPGAGNGAALPRLRSLVDRIGPPSHVRIVAVRSVDETLAALETLEPETVPVAAGGDGTANLLARALWHLGLTRLACGTLPLGTGNAFAHSLGVGALDPAIEALRGGESRLVDMMVTDHRAVPVALVSISVGFESRVVGAIASLRARLGFLHAARRLATAIARPSAGVALVLDGRAFAEFRERHYNVGLYNLPCYAFGARVHPQADPEDGCAEAVSHATAASYWRAVRRGWNARATRAPGEPSAAGSRPAVGETGPGRLGVWHRAVLSCDRPIQVDGESVEGGCVHVRVERRALRWLVPPARPTIAAAA